MILTSDLASLIGFACEAVLYGIYCVIFVISVSCTIWSVSVNRFVFFANCFLFACATTHFGITFNEFYTTLGTAGVDGYANETNAGFGADILISVTDFVGQCILVYRCWTLWGKNYYVVALPFVASLTALGCFCAAAGLTVESNSYGASPSASIAPLVLAAYILPLCVNFILTTLVVSRILYMTRGAEWSIPTIFRGGKKPTAFKAILMIIESGLLYFMVQLIYLVVFALGNNAEQIMSLIAVQVYGIAPSLIIIQVGLGFSAEASTKPSTTNTSMGFARREHLTTTDTSAATSLSTYGSERRGYMVPPGMLQIRKHTGDSELSVRKEEVSEVMVV